VVCIVLLARPKPVPLEPSCVLKRRDASSNGDDAALGERNELETLRMDDTAHWFLADTSL
jgi:hypothetical protein